MTTSTKQTASDAAAEAARACQAYITAASEASRACQAYVTAASEADRAYQAYITADDAYVAAIKEA